MRIGSLDRQVSLRSRGSTQDAAGQPIETWTEFAKPWANIKNRNGVQVLRADKPISVVQTSIRIRRRTDVVAGMRVYHGMKVYEIRAVLDDEESRERVDLVCEVISG